MPCIYCGKEQTCRHRHQDSRKPETAAPGCPRSDDPPSGGSGGRTDLSTSEPVDHGAHALFELTDCRDLLCVLCSHVVPRGRDQQYLRVYHGKKHCRRGEAVEITRGLPPGAVRFEIVK
jgi:hypothetical protein